MFLMYFNTWQAIINVYNKLFLTALGKNTNIIKHNKFFFILHFLNSDFIAFILLKKDILSVPLYKFQL